MAASGLPRWRVSTPAARSSFGPPSATKPQSPSTTLAGALPASRSTRSTATCWTTPRSSPRWGAPMCRATATAGEKSSARSHARSRPGSRSCSRSCSEGSSRSGSNAGRRAGSRCAAPSIRSPAHAPPRSRCAQGRGDPEHQRGRPPRGRRPQGGSVRASGAGVAGRAGIEAARIEDRWG